MLYRQGMMDKTRSKKANPVKKIESRSNTNFWDFLMQALDLAYDLINNGNIFGLFCFGLLGVVFYLIWKLTPDQVSMHLSTLAAFLRHEKFYFLPMGAVIVTLLIALFYMRKKYLNEIRRLVKQKDVLVHGLKKGELKEIPSHPSSDIDIGS
jgi:hypothetical protein